MSAILSALGQLSAFTSAPPVGTPGTAVGGISGPWRPPQWSNTSVPPLTMTATDPTTSQSTAYVFDAVLRGEHTQEQVITLNPVQTGAAISDHAYILPPRLTIEILMSDAMQAYTVDQWNNGPSKSVSAYQTLVAIQAARNPVQVATRLRTYTNMMITNIMAEENDRTRYNLKATVTFTQIITANVSLTSSTDSSSISDSDRPQSTASTQVGQSQVQTVPASIETNNNVENSGVNLSQVPAVSGAGSWSSYPVSGLGAVVGGY